MFVDEDERQSAVDFFFFCVKFVSCFAGNVVLLNEDGGFTTKLH